MRKFLSLFVPFLTLSIIHVGFAQEKPKKALTKAEIVSLVDSLAINLTRYYIYPDVALLMTKKLNAQLNNGTYGAISEPTKLAKTIESDIRNVHYDSHLHVNFEPDLIAPKLMDTEERNNAIKEQLTAEVDNNFNLKKVEVLPANVGYLLLNGFTGHTEEVRPILNAALTFLSGTKALIIDLRFNGGGSTANRLESYFFKEKTHLSDHINRFAKDTISFYADATTTNGPVLLMPIYILTSKNTFSAAEAFSASMQSLKRAVIIGDTTGGGSHQTGFFDLKNGFNARIPFARPVSTATFKDWEGKGVIPDIPVKAANALQKAQEVIYKDLIVKAKSDKEKMRINWAINALMAEQYNPNLNTSLYSKYAGTYVGGLKFYVENNRLMCKNPERGGTDVFTLTAAYDDVFLLDENVQIQFVKDDKNNYSSLKMLWKDGHVTKKARE